MSIIEYFQAWQGRVLEWFRVYRREIVFGGIIFFVAFLSFGLGFVANRELTHAPIIIEQCMFNNESGTLSP